MFGNWCNFRHCWKPVDPRTGLLLPGKLWWARLCSFPMFPARVCFLYTDKNFTALQSAFTLGQQPPWLGRLQFRDTQAFGGLSHFSAQSKLLIAVLASLSCSWGCTGIQIRELVSKEGFPSCGVDTGFRWGKLYAGWGCKGAPGLNGYC